MLPMRLAALLLLPLLGSVSARAEESWPELSTHPRYGGGEKDAAVIVGAENYFVVAKVPGARRNAEDWHAYLTEGLGVPSERVALLRDNEATVEEIRKFAAEKASEVEPGGTLWFVFIGHGAPSQDGKDGILVGVDAQQRADSLYARSVKTKELLEIMASGKQARNVVVLDACFSGRTPGGEPLIKGLQPLVLGGLKRGAADGRTVVLTAARSDQFAGQLPRSGQGRPAFSYLALGGLRGWADENRDGSVTSGELVAFARRALKLARDRTQTPELAAGASDVRLGGGREAGPDLAKIDREGRIEPPDFEVSTLRAVPSATAPKALDPGTAGWDWRSADVEALEKYEKALKLDAGDAKPAEKAAAWRALAAGAPQFAASAAKRAAEWERYHREWQAAEEARKSRLAARDADWAKVSRLLALGVVPEADKRRWAEQFVAAYSVSPGIEAEMSEVLLALAPDPQMRQKLAKMLRISAQEASAAAPSKSAPPPQAAAARAKEKSPPPGKTAEFSAPPEKAPEAAPPGQAPVPLPPGNVYLDDFLSGVGAWTVGPALVLLGLACLAAMRLSRREGRAAGPVIASPAAPGDPRAPGGEAWAPPGYSLKRLLAKGDQGQIYEAEDRALNRKVALKRMLREIRSDPVEKKAFLTEARMMAGLRNPNIVEIYSIAEVGEEVILIFEFLSGKTLEEILRKKRVLAPLIGRKLVKQVAGALAYAHHKMVLHRNLKPEHIMVLDNGIVKVMDFGIARCVQKSLARSGTAATGPEPYQPPEETPDSGDRTGDLYALTVILYEMLAGELPFSGPDQVRSKQVGRFKPLSQTVPGLGSKVDPFLARALAGNPAARFQSAEDFLAAFEEAFPRA